MTIAHHKWLPKDFVVERWKSWWIWQIWFDNEQWLSCGLRWTGSSNFMSDLVRQGSIALLFIEKKTTISSLLGFTFKILRSIFKFSRILTPCVIYDLTNPRQQEIYLSYTMKKNTVHGDVINASVLHLIISKKPMEMPWVWPICSTYYLS